MAATSSQGDRGVPQSNNRRRGWVIASEDGTDVPRPSNFDARASAAAWNKGKGPSQASIPSRASSLTAASAPSPTAASAPSPTLPSPPLKPDSTEAPATSPPSPNADNTPVAPVPPPRIPSSSMSHNRDASSSTTSEAESSSGRRRPSPPLLVPPKQTFRKVPSTRVLPASALSDHQKFMAAVRTSPSGTASSSASGPSTSRSPWANAALRSDLAKLAASRRAQSSSSSSTATSSSVATVTESTATSATPNATASPADPHGKGKGKEVPQSPLQSDAEGFFSSGGKVRGVASADDGTHNRQRSGEDPSAFASSASNQQAPSARVQPKPSLTSMVNPLPPLSEKSANSDIEDAPSPTSHPPSGAEAESATTSPTKLGKRRESLQIEVPPPPPQFKDRYPSILVDSTHASDSEASGTSTGGQRRRRRRSTASMSNKLGGDGEDDDDEYADDDSSWPSTPSTTPLEAYFTSDDARTKPARRTMQTTQEIIAPNAGALGMGRPMVVVTSPSTASEVSSDRRSSSGSGSTSDRTYSSSPPAVASMAPAPALTKIEEDPATKVDAESKTTAPPKSLSFDIPAVPRTRASEEYLPMAAPVRSPSRAMAFLAKMNPSKASNRSSVDAAAASRPPPTAASAEAAKRMSLDNHQRTSADQRRSVELRPILLNATPRPSVAEAPVAAPIATGSNGTAEQLQQRRRSVGRAAVRRNVVPYHSRRASEVSVDASVDSHKTHERVSFDKVTFDPKSSPASQVTALTMESPAVAHPKLVSRSHHDAARAGADRTEHLPTSANAPRDRFAASMPSLHQPATIVEPSTDRRSPSDGEADSRPSAIRLLVDSQQGRMTRDNDSIAEWISVSVHDLPLPNAADAYGNGGAGDFSNEKQQQGKKRKKNKPWKLGRFAASEVVLPSKVASTSSVAPPKRRSASFVKRSPSEEVHAANRTSRESTTSPSKGPVMRNLGFTTANRNVILQNLCAERSISALAASTIYIVGNGRIHVPQPSPLLASAKAKSKATKQKNPSPNSMEPPKAPVVVASSEPKRSSHNVEESHDAYLNAPEGHRMGYDLSSAAGGTVKSMVPELGDWSGSSRHEHGSSEEVMEGRPFRDYEDEGSDLFDSDRSESESESEEEMEYDEEDVEVPVRFGQRVNLSNRAGSAFYSAQPQAVEEIPTTPKAAADVTSRSANANANDSKIVPSTSFERLAPGTVMLHGNDLRICVEDGDVSGRTARPLAYWKAVEVQQPQTSAPTENQIRRQPSSKAMKLEQEVATGIFAAFVGNRSPRRQAQRSSVDLSSKVDQNSPEKRSASRFDARELLVSKVNKSIFSVRSETRTTSGGTEQVIEIIRRHGPRGASHTTQPSESSRASMPSDRLERAFPSPLHSSHDLTHDRSRSNRTDASLATLEDAAERIRIRVQPNVGRGFTATCQNREGQQWTWQGSKVEASVLSPRKDPGASSALDMLEGYDLNLYAVDGSEMVELATYSTDSQVRNALGLFKPRTKSVPKPLPEDVTSIGAPVPPPAQVVPLAIPVRGGAGALARGEPLIPLRGIRGGPLLRSQPTAAASAARGHQLWQHQRAVLSTEAVVQVHNNAVNNVRASVLLSGGGASNVEAGSKRVSGDTAGSSAEETTGNKKMGVLSFSAIESLDRDLVVLTLLAVMGVAKV